MTRLPTLITAAVQAEVGPLVRQLNLRRDRNLLRGATAYRDANHSLIVLLTGMGGGRAIRVVGPFLLRTPVGRVVITGFAGGTDPSFIVGQIVIPADVLDGETGKRYRPSLPCDARGTLYTSDALVQSPAAKRVIYEEHGAAAVDMESATIARCCESHHVAWVCVRAVSDTADAALPGFLMKMARPDGRSNIPAAVGHALLHPWHIPTMMRVGRDAKIAADALAQAVRAVLK